MDEGTSRESYRSELRDRIERFHDVALSAAETRAEQLDMLYEFVREEALRSWANGIEEGMKRASGMLPHGNGAWKRIRPLAVKGTALANGRLRAVQPQA